MQFFAVRVFTTTWNDQIWGYSLPGLNGTRFFPFFSRLFILMINDLNPPSVSSWKYADDTTLAEVVPKGTTSTVQEAIAEVERWSKERKGKGKELYLSV